MVAIAGSLIVGCNSPKPTAVADPSEPSKAAASVNGDTISLDDFYAHMGVKQTAQVASGKGASEVRVLGNFGLQALQELIDQTVLLQMAKEEGVLPTDADVDAELKFQKSLQPEYENVLHSQGLSDKMIRNELMIGLAREHLVMKGVTVEKSEVDRYIKAHPEKFSEPAKAALLYLQVRSAIDKAKVDAELAGGKSFDVVAQQFAATPEAKKAGSIFPISIISEMPKKVQDAINGVPEKSTAPWIVDGSIYTKLYVVKRTASVAKPPTPGQEELVRRAMAMQKGQLKNDFDHRFFEKLRAAKIDVVVPYLKEPWQKAWNQLSEPGKP
jgi:parvulin-like peptidyl-prolyl isomerase